MAIKYFCDLCGEEIKDLNELGNFKIQERTLSFLKHQRQDQLKVTERIFCIDCARKIVEGFTKIKKENGK